MNIPTTKNVNEWLEFCEKTQELSEYHGRCLTHDDCPLHDTCPVDGTYRYIITIVDDKRVVVPNPFLRFRK